MKDIAKEMARIAYYAMEDKKAEDIRVIGIADISSIADYFVIASGNTSPQVEAIIDSVKDKLFEAGYEPKRIEGARNCGWILLDYGDVVIHVFDKEDRLFYDLERIWRDGVIVEKDKLGEE